MANLKLKRALVIGLSAITLASTSVYAKSFSDVKRGGNYSWAYDAIDVLSNNNVISGYTDGTFKPERPVSFPEVMQLLIQVINPSDDEIKEADNKYGKLVKDNDVSNWAQKAMSVALYRDIISESEFKDAASKGFFSNASKFPNRADIAVFFARGLKLSSKGDESYLQHKDKDKMSSSVKGYLASLVKEGVFASTGSDGYFNGDRAIRRSEMAIITKASFDYAKKNQLVAKTESMTGKVVLASKLNNVNVLILESNSSKYSFELSQSTTYKAQGKAAKFEDLQTGQTVKIEYEKTSSSDNLGIAKVVEITSMSQDMVGYVNSKGTNQLTIRYRENSSNIDFRTTSKVSTSDTKTFDLDSNVKITAFGNKIDINKINIDDLVEFKTDANNKITEINLFPKDTNVKGKITDFSTDRSNGYLTLQLQDNKDYKFFITNDTKSDLINSLRKGDTIIIRSNYKVAIELGEGNNLIQGKIIEFRPDDYFNNSIKILGSDNREKVYSLADNWSFEDENGSRIPIRRDDKYVGLYVKLELDSLNKVRRIIFISNANSRNFNARGQIISSTDIGRNYYDREYEVVINILKSDNRAVVLGNRYRLKVNNRFSEKDIVDISGYLDSNNDWNNVSIVYVSPSYYLETPDNSYKGTWEFNNYNYGRYDYRNGYFY